MIKKRSVRISGHETSVTLEQEFWDLLRTISLERSISLNMLVSEIDEESEGNLSSALRVYSLRYLQNKLTQQSV